VGAYGETAGGYSAAGHAYVFNAKTGALVQTLTSPNAQLDGYFGFSVAISGSLVMVGACTEAAGGYSMAGHAYAYSKGWLSS
jgi:outer membrane protein assembly factor BamB